MRWVWRGFALCGGGVFSLLFIAFAAMRPVCIDCGLSHPFFFEEDASSSVRLLDCTSVALNEGPFLATEVRAEFERLVAERQPSLTHHSFMQGELQYSPRGELQAISLHTSTGFSRTRQAPITSEPFGVSPDQAIFYPLRSRQPLAACTTPTRVTFSCTSSASVCQLGAAPV